MPDTVDQMQTLGHVHSSSFRSLALTALRLASHHLAIFSRFPFGTMTHPFAHRFASGLLLLPASHTMLRIVLVAVDRAHASLGNFHKAQECLNLAKSIFFANGFYHHSKKLKQIERDILKLNQNFFLHLSY
jgi:hypothetical protein